MESYEGSTCIPTLFTRSSSDIRHPLIESKQQCIYGKTTIEEYRSDLIKCMRSKTGHIISMKSIVVEGSLKMVISAQPHSDASIVLHTEAYCRYYKSAMCNQ